MATTDKTPTQAERIEALEGEVAKLKADLKKVVKALADGDPTLTAVALG
jgi:hypothetical protein